MYINKKINKIIQSYEMKLQWRGNNRLCMMLKYIGLWLEIYQRVRGDCKGINKYFGIDFKSLCD